MTRYRVMRSGDTTKEYEPSAAVVVLAAKLAAGKGYGLAYRRTSVPAGTLVTVPFSVACCPLAICVGTALTVSVGVPGGADGVISAVATGAATQHGRLTAAMAPSATVIRFPRLPTRAL
jgi:hypothetical protein